MVVYGPFRCAAGASFWSYSRSCMVTSPAAGAEFCRIECGIQTSLESIVLLGKSWLPYLTLTKFDKYFTITTKHTENLQIGASVISYYGGLDKVMGTHMLTC